MGKPGRGKEEGGGESESWWPQAGTDLGRRAETTSWKILEMELQAYSAVLRGLLNVKLHARFCKTASAEVCFSFTFTFWSCLFLICKLVNLIYALIVCCRSHSVMKNSTGLPNIFQ